MNASICTVGRSQSHRSAAVVGTHTLQKQNGAHFTPPELASFVAQRLAPHVEAMKGGVRILDPACGDGNLLVAMATAVKPATLRRCVFVGVEDDGDSFGQACRRLARFGGCTTDLVRGDFLDLVSGDTLFTRAGSMPPVDAIIANPPYVRTQVLGAARAQQLAAQFQLSGRVDLYHAFLVAMARQLRAGGVLGVITSNRFLTTRGGASIRSLLRSRFEIIEIIDLGDTKLFEAAVLPALVFARKRAGDGSAVNLDRATFARVYEDIDADRRKASSVPSVLDALRRAEPGTYAVGNVVFSIATGPLEIDRDDSRPWTLMTSREMAWVERIRLQAACRIGDVARIRVGIKTTADSVFIRDDWKSLPKDLCPEVRFLRPVVSHDDAARWRRRAEVRAERRVLYTHEVVAGKRRAIQFPSDSRAWRYLLSHRQRLESRSYVIDAGRKWYEIWVPQDPEAWNAAKIVFPDISPEPRFFLDDGGSVVDGNCYWITPLDEADDDLLMLILGVANSKVMHRFHELAFPNKLYSQRRRYLTQYVSEYPLPRRDTPAAKRIVQSVRALVDEPASPKAKASLELRIDESVAAAFGVKLDSSYDRRTPIESHRGCIFART